MKSVQELGGHSQVDLSSVYSYAAYPRPDEDVVELEELRTTTSKVFQRHDGSGYALVFQNPVHYQDAEGNWKEIDTESIIGIYGTETFAQSPTVIPLAASSDKSANRDAYAESGYPTTPTGDQFNLYVGYDTWYSKGRTRTFIRFDSPNLPPGSTITGARAYLYQYAVEATSTYQTRTCRITQDWGEYTLTENKQPNVTACSSYVGVGTGTGWKSWDILSYAQAWQSGTANYGIMIQAQNELAKGGIFYSKDCWSQCSNGAYHPYMRLDYTTSPVLRIYEGLGFSPASTVVTGRTVTATFRVRNIGGAAYNGSLRAYTGGTPTFAEQAASIAVNNTYLYQYPVTFASPGSYNVCAQYLSGSWQNLTPDGGVTCRTLSVVDPADVILSDALQLTPNELDHTGGPVRAEFTVQNTGGTDKTERFRARVITGSITFAETGDITLIPAQTHAYSNTQMFSQPGIYEVIAEHQVAGVWTSLIGQGSSFFRVKAPPPPPIKEEKGHPPTGGYAGEPVNTSTGNYFYSFTDLADPTPGLTLGVTRWYNAIDAPEIQGSFGYGSSWTYNMAVNWRADKTAVVHMADGHQAYFIGQVDPADPSNMAGVYSGQGDDIGTLIRMVDGTALLTTADQTTYHFDVTGKLVRLAHSYPAEITVVYSGDRPVQIVHSAGVTYDITYNGNYISRIQSSSGRAVEYSYTPTGDLATVTRPGGSTYTYTYDANHRLTEARDPNGHPFVRNVYDGQGRVVTQYDQTGQASHFSYGAQITDSRVFTDALGHQTVHKYDADYRVIEEIDALGGIITYTYDAQDNVIARKDKSGHLWQYSYDDRGNMLTETDPLGNISTYTYDGRNNQTSFTNPLGFTWTYEYDANNRLTKTTDPIGHTYEYGYDVQGNVIWERDENGHETGYDYNALGLRTVITGALGNVTRMEYDAAGNQTRYIDANGNVAQFFYDDLNRLVRSIDPMGTEITFTYDALGNLLTETDGLGHVKTYTYDVYDRLIAETDFKGNTTQYGYDVLGRMTVITDALGNISYQTYDAVGNLVARQDPTGAVTQYEYDPAGNLIREIDLLGRVTEYLYDAAGRQIEVRRPCDACPSSTAVSRTVYDASGRMVEETDARGATTLYDYDEVGRLATLTDALGNVAAYTYDPTGQLIQEVDPVGAVTRYAYDASGQLVTVTDALGYQAGKQYDKVGNVTRETNARGYSTTYTYDANDRLVSASDALGNVIQNGYDAAGRLTSMTDPLGRTTYYVYDANGNQIELTDPKGHTTRMEYDALNRPIRTIDALGYQTTTGYDNMGRVISETNALGHMTLYTYDQAGRKITEQSALGHTTHYSYDSAGNLVSRQEPGGTTWTFTYDANGNQVSQTGPLGRVSQTEYDLLNQVVKETDALGGVTGNEYDPAGRLVKVTDPRGAVTRYEYDLLGRQTKVINPLGHGQRSAYDANGNLVETEDERGFVTTYTYDELDQQVAETDSLGNSRYTTFDAAGQVTAEVDFNGHTTTYTYDTAGNMTRMTDGLGGVTGYDYDALNRQVSITNANGHTSFTEYDPAGRVIKFTLPGGGETISTFDVLGNQLSETDPAGRTRTMVYDAVGRLILERDPLGNETEYEYDALGNLTLLRDALGRETHFNYDALGRLVQVTDPAGYKAGYGYDLTGNLIREEDPNGHVTQYSYDLAGQQVSKVNPLGRAWQYQYDAAGNQVSQTKPDGVVISYEYDALNRQVKIDYGDATPDVNMTYDAMGNMVTMADGTGLTGYGYDALNRLTVVTAFDGQQIRYRYDAVGNHTGITTPDGKQTTYSYDADNALQAVTTAAGAVAYSREASGLPTRINYPNGAYISYSYDGAGRVTGVANGNAAGTFAAFAYTLNQAGDKTRAVETRTENGRTTTITIDYTYNNRGQLIFSGASDGIETHYAFDGAGNRTQMNGVRRGAGGLESYLVTYTYNEANQLLATNDNVYGPTSYSYNANGARMGQNSSLGQMTFAYDAEDRLVSAQVNGIEIGKNNLYLPLVIRNGTGTAQAGAESGAAPVTPEVDPGSSSALAASPVPDRASSLALPANAIERYSYDGQGRRVSKQQVITATGEIPWQRLYRYGDSWPVLVEQTTAATQSQTARYDYDAGLARLRVDQDGVTGYFHSDDLGSVIGYTGDNGQVQADGGLRDYGDYGQVTPNDWFTDAAYTGHEYEAGTGLYYARNRYYDPESGTFLTPDTYPTDYKQTLNLHRYAYVQGNPISYADPLGLFRWTSASSGVIERGDTLWGIAAGYWDVSPQGVNWSMINAILNFNPYIRDANLIYPGNTLRLPQPMSAYHHLMNINNQVTSNGTNGSNCGIHPSVPVGGNSGNGNNPNYNSNKNNNNNGNNKSPNIHVNDQTRNSPYWTFFSTYSLPSLKEWKVKLGPWQTPKLPSILGPLGGKRFKIKLEAGFTAGFSLNRSVSRPDGYEYGPCVEAELFGELEAELALNLVWNLKPWIKAAGKVEVCLVVRPLSPQERFITLEPSGKAYIQPGVKLFTKLELPGLTGEAGVQGYAQFEWAISTRGPSRTWSVVFGPYAEYKVKVGPWKKEHLWEPFQLKFGGSW